MFESIFELETGNTYAHDNQLVVCHICNKTYSPVKVIVVPTSLCMHYSGTYKRMCAIFYVSDNVCEHVMFPNTRWGSIFLGDIESLPLTILSKFEDVIDTQPSHELAEKAWNHAFGILKERSKSCGNT